MAKDRNGLCVQVVDGAEIWSALGTDGLCRLGVKKMVSELREISGMEKAQGIGAEIHDGGILQKMSSIEELAKSDPVGAMRKAQQRGAQGSPAVGDPEPHNHGLRRPDELQTPYECHVEMAKCSQLRLGTLIPTYEKRLKQLAREQAEREVGAI